jgi:hypothetical protein
VISFLPLDRSGWTAKDWQALFNERTTIAEFDGGLPRREAEAGAFKACVVEWLNRNLVCSAADRCRWCGGRERGDKTPADRGHDVLPQRSGQGGRQADFISEPRPASNRDRRPLRAEWRSARRAERADRRRAQLRLASAMRALGGDRAYRCH